MNDYQTFDHAETDSSNQNGGSQYGVIQRCALAFYRPSALAEDIKKKPDFLWVALITMLLTLLMFLLSYESLFKSMLDALMMQFNEADMSYDILELQLAAKGTAMFTIVLGVIFVPLGTLIFAGIYHGISCIFDNQGNYKEVLSYLFYVGLISSVGSILGGIVTYTTGIYPVSFSLAMFVDQVTQPILYSVLNTLNLFGIWYYVALIIGFKKIEELSTKKAAFSVLIVPVVLMFITIVGATMF